MQPVAIKSLSAAAKHDMRLQLLREAAVMMQFSHENVVKLVGVVTHSEPILLLTEMGDRSLYLKLRDKAVPDDELFPIASDVLAGMEYLASKGYVHRDVAR